MIVGIVVGRLWSTWQPGAELREPLAVWSAKIVFYAVAGGLAMAAYGAVIGGIGMGLYAAVRHWLRR
jgi:ABC-type nitrate/sulfonate/bicarbonate transport system permease component